MLLPLFLVFGDESFHSKYAGEENRRIKSLSQDDVEELKNGGGWGLAKVAELNGVPGPAHILEMKEQISLTSEQEERIKAIYNKMKKEAVALGEQLISFEIQLNDGFLEGSIDLKTLKELIQKIETIRGRLRLVHLSTHLITPDILTEEQITKYNILRGYAQDPCQNIPAGHSAKMWKKHNGCE